MAERHPIGGSKDALWMAPAVAAPACEILADDLAVDVAIIGAGFTGLNAALALANAGTSVAVSEAVHLGFGASGRRSPPAQCGAPIISATTTKVRSRDREPHEVQGVGPCGRDRFNGSAAELRALLGYPAPAMVRGANAYRTSRKREDHHLAVRTLFSGQ